MAEIIYIHGLTANGATMLPFKLYNKKGHTITYNTFNRTLTEMIDEVDEKILEIVTKDTELILVGWSMGGLIANRLHQKDWKIKLAIYIASPLNGASIFSYIPISPWNNILKYLAEKEKEKEPPHEYHTYSLGWGILSFDGRVFIEDTKLDEDKHEHITFTEHILSVIDVRVLRKVYNKIKEHAPMALES